MNSQREDGRYGTASLPFAPGKNGRVAVEIMDDREIESLKILEIV